MEKVAPRGERFAAFIEDGGFPLSGRIDPMLERHGDASEAAQYSGHRVGADGVSPFRNPRAKT